MGDDPLDSGLSSSSSSSSSSPKQTTLLQPPSDEYIDVDEGDDDDYDDDENENDNELKSELGCPFCFKAFDAVGLFCHIDDVHPIETKSGICPVCAGNLGTNLAAHLSTQHDIILKALHKKILCDGDFDSVESFLRKELKDEYLQLKGSSSVVTSSKLAPDPLLSSFIYNVSPADEPDIVQPCSSTDANLSESMLERDIQTIPLSEKDQEKAQRCEFVHSILFSTIHDDNL